MVVSFAVKREERRRMGREGRERERLGRSSLTSRVCEELGNLATQRGKKPT